MSMCMSDDLTNALKESLRRELDERDSFRDEIHRLTAENSHLRAALKKIADTVDESLLLDEDLSKAWGSLRHAVVEARFAALPIPTTPEHLTDATHSQSGSKEEE